jgi:hypothetical protein
VVREKAIKTKPLLAAGTAAKKDVRIDKWNLAKVAERNRRPPALVPMRWGLVPSWWKKTRQGRALNLQRPRRERRRKADVPVGVQAQPLHHSGIGLLRMEASPYEISGRAAKLGPEETGKVILLARKAASACA